MNCFFLIAIDEMKITAESSLKFQVKHKIWIEIFVEAMKCCVGILNPKFSNLLISIIVTYYD